MLRKHPLQTQWSDRMLFSSFFLLVFGSKATSKMEDMELRVLQPTMSSTKMVDGALLTGTCMQAL